MRRGVSYIEQRYSNANNNYMTFYYKNKASKYIAHLDANNLYRWTMDQFFLTRIFKYLTKDEFIKLGVSITQEDNPESLILEVDLELPENFYDLHSDYPLAQKNIEIKVLSDYCREIANKHNISVGGVKRLEGKFGKQESICSSLLKVNN